MTDRMDLSLDDIIDKSKSSKPRGGRGQRRGGPSRGRGGNRNRQQGNNNNSNEITATVTFGSYEGQQQNVSGGAFRRARRGRKGGNPYRSNDPEKKAALNDESTLWEHDKFVDEEPADQMDTTSTVRTNRLRIETGTKIAISDLEYSVSEDNLKELFSQAGAVKKLVIFYDRSGRSKGTGEIIFDKKEDANAAIQKFNGVELDGKRITLSLIGTNVPIANRRRGGPRRSFIRGRRGRGGFRN